MVAELLQTVGGGLVPIVIAVARHYGKKQAKEMAAMRDDIKELIRVQAAQCVTGRRAYRHIRKEQDTLAAKLERNGNKEAEASGQAEG